MTHGPQLLGELWGQGGMHPGWEVTQGVLQGQLHIIIMMMMIIVTTTTTATTTTILELKGTNRIFLQFPHCAVNCLHHVRSSGRGAIVCKSRATQTAHHVQHVVCHLVRRVSSANKVGRVQITFILALLYCLKRLTDKGGEEAGVPGENP